MVSPKKKNHAAVALAKLRFQKLGPERRSEIAAIAGRVGGLRRMENLSAEQRRKIALKGLKARWDAYYKAHPEKLKAKLERSKSKKKNAKEAD